MNPYPRKKTTNATEKACSCCKFVKPMSEFGMYQRVGLPPRPDTYCRPCKADKDKARREGGKR